MARIAHIHWQFNLRGGGENVAMNALEAVQNDHHVTLITDRQTNLEDLNEYYGTNVSPKNINIKIVNRYGLSPARFLSMMRNHLQGGKLGMLRTVPLYIANRMAEPLLQDADLVINTSSEMGTKLPSLQYVHYPLFNRVVNPDASTPDTLITRFVHNALVAVEGLDPIHDNTHLLTNSNWTADIIEETYDVTPRVIYPPVKVDEFATSVQWKDKESGFVAVGRISSGKRILDAIKIIDRLRSNGHDVHLHIIGSTPDTEYADLVKQRATKTDGIIFEGKVPRSRLIELLQRHRYGIHAKRDEHFGLAVAEMVAAGAIPFVPSNGGQQEIVNHREELLWTVPEMAVDKIETVLCSQGLQDELRNSLPDIKSEYGRDRFQSEFSRAVNDIVN